MALSEPDHSDIDAGFAAATTAASGRPGNVPGMVPCILDSRVKSTRNGAAGMHLIISTRSSDIRPVPLQAVGRDNYPVNHEMAIVFLELTVTQVTAWVVTLCRVRLN